MSKGTIYWNFCKIKKLAKDRKGKNPYLKITGWFGDGNVMDILNDLSDRDYRNRLLAIDGLDELVERVYQLLHLIPHQVFRQQPIIMWLVQLVDVQLQPEQL